MSKQKVKQDMADLGKPKEPKEPRENKKARKQKIELQSGRRVLLTPDLRESGDLITAFKLAILQYDDDIKSGKANQKSYKKPSRKDFSQQAQTITLEGLK